MINNTFFFIAIISVFSLSCFAQGTDAVSSNSKKGNTSLKSDNLAANEDYAIVSYHVVEKIGGNVTTYNVSNLNLINKNDLGPNNSRVITPKYGKVKIKAKPKAEDSIEVPKIAFDSTIDTEKLIKENELTPPPAKKLEFIMVDIMSTYERILDKGGYESLEMLKKVANNRYFKGELREAYKWYSQLFAKTSDLEIVYYYRYAQVLKSVGQTNKANEMMKVFENKKLP
ncbi:MAG: hypothetical protein V4572_01670 [Bacteroidota bacterium]